MNHRAVSRLLALSLLVAGPCAAVRAADGEPAPAVEFSDPLVPGKVACGNFIYAGTRSSVCFAEKFLTEVAEQTTLDVEPKFRAVRLDSDKLFDLPFCVWSGEGSFSLTDKERANLRKYLLNGGFVLSSPSCSNADWDKSFRREIALALPEHKLLKIPMSHPMFSVLNQVPELKCKTGNTALLEGVEVNGRLVMVHSKEGLNDVANAKGCCCCGGNEIKASRPVNANILTYALLY